MALRLPGIFPRHGVHVLEGPGSKRNNRRRVRTHVNELHDVDAAWRAGLVSCLTHNLPGDEVHGYTEMCPCVGQAIKRTSTHAE